MNTSVSSRPTTRRRWAVTAEATSPQATDRPAAVATARQNPRFNHGRKLGREWAAGAWGRRLSATERELEGAERFWKESLGRDPFGFLPRGGSDHRDFLFEATHPRLAQEPGASAAFWAARDLESLTLNTDFLTGFLDGALDVWFDRGSSQSG